MTATSEDQKASSKNHRWLLQFHYLLIINYWNRSSWLAGSLITQLLASMSDIAGKLHSRDSPQAGNKMSIVALEGHSLIQVQVGSPLSRLLIQDQKIIFNNGSQIDRIERKSARLQSDGHNDEKTPERLALITLGENDRQLDLHATVDAAQQDKANSKSRDAHSEQPADCSKGMVLELQHLSLMTGPAKPGSTLSTEQSPQTNFRLVKKFPTISDDKKSSHFQLEVKAPSPKKPAESLQQSQNTSLNKSGTFQPPKSNSLQAKPLAGSILQPPSMIPPPGQLRKAMAPKKKDLAYLPPPEYFKKKRIIKNINFAQWKAQSVLRILPGKSEKQEESKFEDLDDFTSLLTKRLFENLDENEVAQGSYTLKEGNFCLIMPQDKSDKKKDDMMVRDLDKKSRHLEEILPGPCFGLLRSDEKRGSFNRDEVLRFELQYKDILYDTHIKVGRFYQAFIPHIKPCKAFLVSEVIYGLPPKNNDSLRPPKLTIEYKQKPKLLQKDKDKNSGQKSDGSMEEEELKPDLTRTGSYVNNDDFKGELTIEQIYVPRRNLQEYLEWDPELVQDFEVVDMIDQVLQDFKGEPRINAEVLHDYLKLCRLNKERYLDHLELDHDDFRKYIHMVLHKTT